MRRLVFFVLALNACQPAAKAVSPAADAPSSADLFRRHQGNLRDALRELYDFHAAAR